MKCKDYSVSGETFTLAYNKDYDMLVTQPQPLLADLPKYYESEAYISHTDSKKSLVDKLYQTVKQITLKQKLALINRFGLENKTLLDVGCGTGDFLLTAQSKGWIITGVEPSEKAKEVFRNKLNEDHKVELLKDISKLIEFKQKFSVITLWHVLEHVPNIHDYVKQLKTLLLPEGKLIIAVPNYKSHDAIHYGKFWAAYDVPRHLWHFSKKSIETLFDEADMQVEKILPMKFDAYYVSLLSEQYKTGKASMLKGFFRGWYSNLQATHSKEYSSLIYIIKNRNKAF